MIRACVAPALIACAIGVGSPTTTMAQDGGPIRVGPPPEAIAAWESARAVERQVQAAILSEDVEAVRDRHIAEALELSRRFVDVAPADPEAHYWLAVSLGVKTEYSGALAKLTTGRECYQVTMKVLELDPDHAGAHEMVGRIHAAVMRLPWLVRKLGATLGMGQALGQASWETAEEHLRRAAELDPDGIAPRLELGKLLADRERPDESRTWFESALEIAPSNDLERSMHTEIREILGEGPAPG